MTIEGTGLRIGKVERVSRVYDEEGRVVRETMEYWFPEESSKEVGFKTKKVCKN